MQSEENPITSQSFADIIVEYQGDRSLLNSFGNVPVTIINEVVALVNIPLQQMDNSITSYAYARIPSIGGLVSDNSLEASGIIKIRNVPNFNLRGQGVLIAVIDTGIEYTNPIFQNADKTTRIVSIWDQTIEGSLPQEGIKYGTVYTKEQINTALQSDKPYQVVPSKDDNGHGTMVAGIAGGSESLANNFAGVAPDAEFVIVKLKQAKNYLRNYYFVPENVFCIQETDFLFALEYVLGAASKSHRPLVICVSNNGSQGAHDGRSVAGRYLSGVASRQGIGIVIAGGNEGNARRHYYGTVDPSTGYDIVELNVGENEMGFPMEIWGQSPSILTIDILSPSGEYIPRIIASRNESRQISFIFEDTIIDVIYTLVETESGDQLILLRFSKPAPGIWKFHVYERGDLQVGFHIWLPMDGFISDNTFFIRSDPYTTILAVGNTRNPVTVTAYNNEDGSLYLNSSRGYTRLNEIKPNIAAPGVNITGPALDQSFVPYTGTSVAAAHTTGVVAMLLEWGIVNGNLPGMSTVEINKLLMRGAKRETDLLYPNRDWGYGKLDVFNVFDSLRGETV